MSTLTGTGAMIRLALRRDRILLPVWVYGLTALVVGTAESFARLYPTVASRRQFATGIGSNPAVRAIYGHGFDLTSVGGLTAWRIGGSGAVLVALMSLLVVTRHTRAEEETGRLELLGATVVGRHAGLAAAVAVAVGADLAIGVLTGLGLVGLGLSAAGSFALGLSFGAAGMVFAAVAAVTAQLTGSARAANGIAAGALGAAYLLRAVGDAAGPGGPSWLSWLSPVGWIEQSRAFAGERWWVFGPVAALVAVCLGGSAALAGRRDTGAGLFAERPGPAGGAPRLAGPFALAWRLHRGTLAGWSIGFAVLGVLLGSIASGIGDLVDGSPQVERAVARLGGQGGGSGDIVDAYLAESIGVAGLIAAAYAIQAALRLRAEETAQRAEPVLATPVGRIRWACGHLLFAGAGSAVPLLAVGLGAGVAHGLRTGDLGTQVPRLAGAALVQLPAVWVLAGIAVAAFGLVPQATVAGWAALAACVLVGQLGPVLRLDQWALDVSPFTHLPKLPGGTVAAAPVLVLVGLAAALVLAGLVGLRRRDVG
ncbi:MAG TPA: ABC transporter permease [Mycobacteriales bacterium]|nr:ABC transporter permease [Mycobacteriales bacterium]